MEKTGKGATAPLITPLPSPPPPLAPAACYGTPALAAASFDEPYYPEAPTYVLLPFFPRRRRRCRPCRGCASLLSSFSLLSAVFLSVLLFSAAYFLWPSDPELQVARLELDNFGVTPPPSASLDVSLGLKLRIRNPDFFAVDYRSIVSSIAYRGRPLGSMTTEKGGHVRARGVSYVDAELRLDGIQVLNDVIYLIEDLASGSLLFDTITEIEGQLRLFFFHVPVKGKISCAVTVKPETQSIIGQDCHPE